MLAGVIDAHLTGDGFAWTDLLAPAAIVFAAILAARFARFNLREQLAHDSRSRVRDATLATLNSVVDEVTAVTHVLDSSQKAFRWYANKATHYHQSGGTDVASPTTQPAQDASGESLAELRALHVPLLAQAFKLSIRFGDDHPIIGAFALWRETLDRLVDDYEAALTNQWAIVAGLVDGADTTRGDLARALHSFLTAARDWAVGAEPDPADDPGRLRRPL